MHVYPPDGATFLSPHFRRREFICPCCGLLDLDATLLCGLELLRVLIGSPINASSGYRCEKHNLRVGGYVRSRHLAGQAVDAIIVGVPRIRVVEAAESIYYFSHGGIGVYPDSPHVHLDVRGQRARWGYLDGNTITYDEAMQMLRDEAA